MHNNIKHLVSIIPMGPGKDCAHMQMYGVIGDGVDGNEFGKELIQVALMGVKEIAININSSGGSIVEGMSILNAMNAARRSGVAISTYGVGIMDSMASNILAYGNKGMRYAASFSSAVVHEPMYKGEGGEYVSIDEMPEGEVRMEMLAMKNQLLNLLCTCTGKDREYLENKMKEGTRRTANELLEMGMVDAIEEVPEMPNTTKMDPVQAMAACSGISIKDFTTKQYNNKKQEMDTKKESIELTSVVDESIVNEAVLKSKEEEIGRLKNETKELQEELEKVKKSQIDSYVNAQIADGKFSADKKDELVNAALSSFDTFKIVCESLNATFVDVTKSIENTSNGSNILDLAKRYHEHDVEGSLDRFKNEVGESKFSKIEEYYTENIDKIID